MQGERWSTKRLKLLEKLIFTLYHSALAWMEQNQMLKIYDKILSFTL